MSYSSWRRTLCSVVLAAFPCSIYAVDGVVLIDQNHALAGNITPGDTPGFPVTISQPGSYKLSGNLTVPDANTTAIQIAADHVTLDLNGFAIIGPVVCTSSPAVCPPAGTGIGINADNGPGKAGPRGTKVLNGTIRGIGQTGIVITGTGAYVEKLTVNSSGGNGFVVAGSVVNSSAILNGGFGILAITVLSSFATDNHGNGIVLDGSGGVAIGDIASFNGGNGIQSPNGTVTSSTMVRNTGFGISAVCPSSIIGNTVVSNTAGSITTTNLEPCVLVNNATRP
jgi:hypothetical protein